MVRVCLATSGLPFIHSGVGVSFEKPTLRRLRKGGAFLSSTAPPSGPSTPQGLDGRSSKSNLVSSLTPLPCLQVQRSEVTCPGHPASSAGLGLEPTRQKNRSCCVQTSAQCLAGKGLSVWLSQDAVALVQRRPTSCRGSVLSKSRGGEKVKQTFNATSHEPQSGGGVGWLQGETIYTDLGFCRTTLKDVALHPDS